MKKLIFALLLVFGSLFTANAQWVGGATYPSTQTTPSGTALGYMVITTSTSGQTQGVFAVSGCDSVHISSASTATTVPSGAYQWYHYLGSAANVVYSGTITMPSNPVIGQTVALFSNKTIYHKSLTTSPKAVVVDTLGGSNYAEWFWNGYLWEEIQ